MPSPGDSVFHDDSHQACGFFSTACPLPHRGPGQDLAHGAHSRHHAQIVNEPSFLGNTDALVHIRVTSVIKAYTFLSVVVTERPGGSKANLEQPLKKTRIHEFCRACAETHTYVNAQVDTGAWVFHE